MATTTPAVQTFKTSLTATPILDVRLDSQLDTFDLKAAIEFPISDTATATGTAGADIGAIGADTESLGDAGMFEFHIFLYGGAALDFQIEHRDAANAVTLEALTVTVPANDPRYIKLRLRTIATGERVRITLQSEPANGIVYTSTIYGRRVL